MKHIFSSVTALFALVACTDNIAQVSPEEAKSEPSISQPENKFELQYEVAGDYICTISENVGIASAHTEGSGPPKAFTDSLTPWRFKMRITREAEDKSQYRMIELPYTSPDRNVYEWHTENSVLHSPYIGDGVEFAALEDQAFVSFHKTIHENEDGDMSFYHAGFAWAGGEDSRLLARWGRCKMV